MTRPQANEDVVNFTFSQKFRLVRDPHTNQLTGQLEVGEMESKQESITLKTNEDVAALVSTVKRGFEVAISDSGRISDEDLVIKTFLGDEILPPPEIVAGRQAFAALLVASNRRDREFGTLKAFVEDVRDSKLRATSDEECVMAFVRLGNRAGELLAGLAEGKASEET